jgi:hypothetical protein
MIALVTASASITSAQTREVAPEFRNIFENFASQIP